MRVTPLDGVASALNPKTLPISLTWGHRDLRRRKICPMRALALVLLTGTASIGVVVPAVLLTVVPGQRSARVLERVQRVVELHIAAAAIMLLVLVGMT